MEYLGQCWHEGPLSSSSRFRTLSLSVWMGAGREQLQEILRLRRSAGAAGGTRLMDVSNPGSDGSVPLVPGLSRAK